MFNDDWMRERGFLDQEYKVASDLIQNHIDKPLVTVKTEELVSHAIERMRDYKISQIPVEDVTGIVGSVDEGDLFRAYMENNEVADLPIKDVMGAAYPIVQKNATVAEVSKLISKENNAVLVDLGDGKHHIITKHDIINAM